MRNRPFWAQRRRLAAESSQHQRPRYPSRLSSRSRPPSLKTKRAVPMGPWRMRLWEPATTPRRKCEQEITTSIRPSASKSTSKTCNRTSLCRIGLVRSKTTTKTAPLDYSASAHSAMINCNRIRRNMVKEVALGIAAGTGSASFQTPRPNSKIHSEESCRQVQLGTARAFKNQTKASSQATGTQEWQGRAQNCKETRDLAY